MIRKILDVWSKKEFSAHVNEKVVMHWKSVCDSSYYGDTNNQNKGSFPIHPMDHPCINAQLMASRAKAPPWPGQNLRTVWASRQSRQRPPAIRASVSLPRAGRTPEPPILFLRPKKVPACWSLLLPPETFHLATHGLRVRMSWGRGKGRAFTVEKRTLFEVLNEDPKHWNPKIVN